jgi:hypothetical protein
MVSVVLWRELRAERQLVADLRAQQDEARVVAPEANRQAQSVVTVIPEPSAIAPTPADSGAAPPVEAARDAISAARLAEISQRQNDLLGDSEFQKARLTTARRSVQSRYAGLATELGLSEMEADTLFTILAESDLRRSAELTSLVAGGTATADAAASEMARLQTEHKQQQKDAIVARLGAARYAEFKEFEETQPSRQRVNTFVAMLSSRGAPLTTAQSKSLATVMIAEQRRMESQPQMQPADPSARAEREIESDGRIVAAAANFLTPQQTSLINAKFEEMAEGKRASSVMQQRLTDSQPTATGRN